jgi:hypothetical protein
VVASTEGLEASRLESLKHAVMTPCDFGHLCYGRRAAGKCYLNWLAYVLARWRSIDTNIRQSC